jgi:hypothetical protein
MGKHTGCKRQFTQLSRAWYGSRDGVVDEVTIGLYHQEGGTTGEFSVVWKIPYLARDASPQLQSWDDSWSALFQFGDLLESMADLDDKDVSPEAFCQLLTGLGIADATKETAPDMAECS